MKRVKKMDLINEIDVNQEKLDELRDLGIELSPEQRECIKYEAIGRALSKKTNVLHAESGAVVTTDFFDALLVTSVSQLTTRDFFLISPEVQPLYNIQNEYMGFLFYGKIRNLKKEKKRRKKIREILNIIAMVAMFTIGFIASFPIIIVSIIALVTFGYSSFMIGSGER